MQLSRQQCLGEKISLLVALINNYINDSWYFLQGCKTYSFVIITDEENAVKIDEAKKLSGKKIRPKIIVGTE